MSTFSGLSGALSSLIAQRQALEVSGQNVANAKTAGYTRQRADMTSVQALTTPSMFSAANGAGNGVRVSGITRMGDVFLDARLRTETSAASFQAAQAKSLDRLETLVTEPSDTGITAQLQTFWSGWQDVGNDPDDPAARQTLIGNAKALISQIASGYRGVETQWAQARTEAQSIVTQVNTTATAVADLNEQIRAIQVSGGSANELVDQRSLLVTQLSSLVGASAREREDGTIDVMVAGNALVRGVKATAVQLSGPSSMAELVATPSVPVSLSWGTTPPTPLSLQGGTLASHISVLSPTGSLMSAADSFNDLATSLETSVNAVHQTGTTLTGATGVDFFVVNPDASLPKALRLSTISDPAQVAAADGTKGTLDGSIADKVSQIVSKAGGPDSVWRSFVVDLGVQTQAATQRAKVTEVARATAENLQLSQASVDLDEESVNMLAYQRAYEGAARVLTAIDEMLDVLINRTGVVGR
ncbi:flagellar hook-associated protein FlgK [Actinotalea subterranea]|uniref:flagellar hook-associated protein FlgK n=1 Tax=Actinotalea subterranea TaxID=2607497 RepID=UPI0011EE83B0|nr:flagellar hook-associated protein FlgK [Actinotalea subterranea]